MIRDWTTSESMVELSWQRWSIFSHDDSQGADDYGNYTGNPKDWSLAALFPLKMYDVISVSHVDRRMRKKWFTIICFHQQWEKLLAYSGNFARRFVLGWREDLSAPEWWRQYWDKQRTGVRGRELRTTDEDGDGWRRKRNRNRNRNRKGNKKGKEANFYLKFFRWRPTKP